MKPKVHPIALGLLLLPGLGPVVVFVGAIVGMALAQSVGYFNLSGTDGFSLSAWQAQWGGTRLWRSLAYSLRIAFQSSVLSLALAYPLALWLRKPFPGSGLLGSLIKAPLLVHGLVAAFLYVNFVSFNGFLNQILVAAGLLASPVRMQNDDAGIGVIVLQLWKNIPFAFLLLSGAVQCIGDDLLQAARDLGAGPWTRFRRVIAPLTLKSLQAAMMVIFIGAAGDYSFQVFAGPVSVQSVSQYLFSVQTEASGWNQAAVVALALMGLSIVGSVFLSTVTGMLVRGGTK